MFTHFLQLNWGANAYIFLLCCIFKIHSFKNKIKLTSEWFVRRNWLPASILNWEWGMFAFVINYFYDDEYYTFFLLSHLIFLFFTLLFSLKDTVECSRFAPFYHPFSKKFWGECPQTPLHQLRRIALFWSLFWEGPLLGLWWKSMMPVNSLSFEFHAIFFIITIDLLPWTIWGVFLWSIGKVFWMMAHNMKPYSVY